MLIIDCFTFYNELDMLEYRLRTLYDVVDAFILVEATLTHRGNPKPLYYIDNALLFSKYADKIIHIVDRDLNPSPVVDLEKHFENDVWKNEHHQRNAIDVGLKRLDLGPDDLLIIGDVDEIPNPNVLKYLRDHPEENIEFVSMRHDMYYYNLTVLNQEKWFLQKLVSYKYYVENLNRTPQHCRAYISQYCIERGGWHLSYFGDAAFIQNKLKEFAHQEFNQEIYTNLDAIQEKIKEKQDLLNRPNEKWIHISPSENRFLPPNPPNTWLH